MELTLDYPPPLHWASLLGFLAARATPGVEEVSEGSYGRTVFLDGNSGIVTVAPGEREGSLRVRAVGLEERSRTRLSERLIRVFDLWADTPAITARLAEDSLLGPLLDEFPGLRVPGSWDPFETAVRAIVGQVVSVKVATTLIGRLVRGHGDRLVDPVGSLELTYPSPERLAEADLSGLGLTKGKARSIRALARAVAGGELRLDEPTDPEETLARLLELPGVGPWTANYIAMRALGHADAFPAGDLILRRAAAKDGEAPSEKELEALSERWRPYRAYAAMLLWASYSAESRNRS